MGQLTAYASRESYARHVTPIMRELERRGHDVLALPRSAKYRAWGGPVLVASAIDATRFPRAPVIYAEHGAGQTYVDGPPFGYAGGPDLANVRLFICPGEHVARRWRAAYPQAAVETVGSPALDRHFEGGAVTGAHDPPTGALRTVVVTSHWACGVCPESMPALPRFLAAVSALQHPVVGHAHPRIARRLRGTWEGLGIEYDPDPDSVLHRADVLVGDNTSLLYEAAALDIPVVCLNDPSYRRDVEHGLRFWSHVPGAQCDEPEDLAATIDRALRDPSKLRALRRAAATHVYAALDGRAAERAADAIEELL